MKKLFSFILMCFLMCISLSGCIIQSLARDIEERESLTEDVFTYVKNHEESLKAAMDEILSWSENYSLIFRDEDEIRGQTIGEWPHNRPRITDDAILSFFADNETIHGIEFLASCDIVVFETEGFGIAPSSVAMGFYYTPQDQPAWINSEELERTKPATGKYIYAPMIPEGDGWEADPSILDPEDTMMGSYSLYTERICENLFYYEIHY